MRVLSRENGESVELILRKLLHHQGPVIVPVNEARVVNLGVVATRAHAQVGLRLIEAIGL